MSDNDTSYTIDLPVKGQPEIDAAARSVDVLAARLDKTSKAFERVGIAADAQRDKLRIASELGNTKGAEQAAARLRLLTDRQAEYATKVEQAKAALNAQGAALDELKKKATLKGADEGEIRLEGIKRALNHLGGPLAEVGGKAAEVGGAFQKLGKILGGAGPYVATVVLLAAISAALVAVAVAAGLAIVRIAEWAVGLADVNRHLGLLSQGMARSVKGGEELNSKIDELTKRLPLTREEIASTAGGLAGAGLRGKELSAWLERSATWAARIKFGPNFQAEMLSLEQQSKVFHENIRGVFGGLKVEGLLGALAKMVGLLDESTESGKAIKVVFESLFQPLIDWLAKSEPKIEAFFLQLEIWALEALIAIKPYGSTLLKVAEAFLIVGAIVGGTILLAFALLAAAIAAPFATLAAVIYAILNLVEGLPQLIELGRNIIGGIVQGIEAAGGKVWEALKGAVIGGIDKVKAFLGIASPSKLMADQVGFQMGAGTAEGVEASTGRVQSALESMASPPDVQGRTAPAASSSGSNLSGNTFNFYGVEGAEDAVARFNDMLTRAVEGDTAQLGAVQHA